MFVAALLAAPSAALAAGNSIKPRAINCESLKYKPTRIILSCGDAGTWLGKLKWSSWGRSKAVGTGNFNLNTCTPDCAGGKATSVAVTVTLSNPKTCPGRVEKAFKQAAITYKTTRPQGAPAKVKFACPLPGAY